MSSNFVQYLRQNLCKINEILVKERVSCHRENKCGLVMRFHKDGGVSFKSKKTKNPSTQMIKRNINFKCKQNKS